MADDLLINKAATIEQSLQIPITIAVITRHLGELLDFAQAILRGDAARDHA